MAAVVAKAVGRIGWANPSGCFWLYAIGRTMIDTGPPSEWSGVRAFVEKHGIERVVVGHHHEDHAGNAGELVKMGLQVLAPAQTIDLVRQPLQQEFYRRVVWGSAAYPLPLTHEHNRLPAVVPIPEAGVSLHLVHAPGHAPDHHVFLVPERGWLFGADIFVSARRKMYRPEEDPLTEMASLRKVLELDFETLYCSHRGLIKHGRAALQERLDYLTEVQARIHELASLGLSHRQLTRRVLGREGVIYWFSGRIHSKSNLAYKLLVAGAEQQQQQQQQQQQKAAARV